LIDTDIIRMARSVLEEGWTRMPGGSFSGAASLRSISAGGSDRYFIRAEEDGLSAVVLVQPGGGTEFERYLVVGDFLRERGIPVPEFYSVDNSGILVMEDLGDIHLHDALEEADPSAELAFYRDCLDILFRLQTSVTEAERNNQVLDDMIFSEEILLGETDYFAGEFVKGYAGMDLPVGWEEERRLLASELSSHPAVFMHRDFQSRNIMVKDGSLRLVDFQTAHRGPGMYDTASILKDPYHPLEPGTRKTLLMELYYRFTDEGIETGDGFGDFERRFALAGIQRCMQALAAFSFLGLKKNKEEFLEYIQPGLKLLADGLDESVNLPAIRKLVDSIAERLNERN
jgi:aminoglycoside/choline kinase family phosphotransferase